MLTIVLADCTARFDKKAQSEEYSLEIVHNVLLFAHYTNLAHERELRTIIHTKSDDVFLFEPDVKIPEHLEDFFEMMKRCVEGECPTGLVYTKQDLISLLNDELGEKIIMSPKGTHKEPMDCMTRSKDYVVVIGGFKKGDFISPVYKNFKQVISISDQLMKPWTVAAEVVVAYQYSSFE